MIKKHKLLQNDTYIKNVEKIKKRRIIKGLSKKIIERKPNVVHAKVKSCFGLKSMQASNLLNSVGESICSTDEKVKRWKRYTEKLCNGMDKNDRCIERKLKIIQENKGDPIIKNKFDKVLRS